MKKNKRIKSKPNCDTCTVTRDIQNSDVPACCAWYLENVVVLGRSVDECPVYKEVI